ncbi:hypothetical protein GCM10020256_23250 [Streptomyces thermocoprophilus]
MNSAAFAARVPAHWGSAGRLTAPPTEAEPEADGDPDPEPEGDAEPDAVGDGDRDGPVDRPCPPPVRSISSWVSSMVFWSGSQVHCNR